MPKSSITILSIILILIIGVTTAVIYSKNKATEPDTDDQISTSLSSDDQTTDSIAAATSTSPASNSATTPPENSEVTRTVSYDGTAFSPKTLTIKAGETVTFVNNSKRLMWVASDPHPVHTNLSSFDALKGYAAGQSYSYTFAKNGVFAYHDHLNSNVHGTITVEP